MRILATGSIPDGATEDDVASFKDACRAIGIALAKRGYTLVGGSYRESSADRHIVDGMSEVDGLHRVIVERPERVPDDFVDFPQDLKHIDLVPFRTGSSWAVGRVRQILQADAVLLIGGHRGTEQVGYMASALGLPILPIGAFKGAAATFVRLFESDFRRTGVLDTVKQFSLKSRASDADAIMTTLEKLRRNNPFRVKRGFGYYALGLAAIVFVGVWELLYASSSSGGLATLGMLFLLLELSALAGAGLRLLMRLFTGDLQEIDLPNLAVSFSIALVLAWALGIAYLAIGQDMANIAKYAPDFSVSNLGIRMGIIGILAGFLTETALGALKKYLDRAVGAFFNPNG